MLRWVGLSHLDSYLRTKCKKVRGMVAYTFSISPQHLSNHADLSVSKYPLFSQNLLFWISLKRNKAVIYIFRITVLRTFVKVSSLMFHFVVIHIFVCLSYASFITYQDYSCLTEASICEKCLSFSFFPSVWKDPCMEQLLTSLNLYVDLAHCNVQTGLFWKEPV